MKKVLIVFLLTVVGIASLLILLGAFLLFRVSGKGSAPSDSRAPATQTRPTYAERQVEGHTCGMHAVRSLYRAYGLRPDAENIRFRMGVDVVAVPGDETSAGTLQPDMLRVLVQDGFTYRLMVPESHDRQALVDHLQSGDLALLLIARPQNGNLHWVVAETFATGKLRLLDSLEEAPLEVPLSFYDDHVVSAVLVAPCVDDCANQVQAHRDGMADMVRCNTRWQALKMRHGH